VASDQDSVDCIFNREDMWMAPADDNLMGMGSREM
jgi:hypothetical protein